jgi:hypothetical protein
LTSKVSLTLPFQSKTVSDHRNKNNIYLCSAT